MICLISLSSYYTCISRDLLLMPWGGHPHTHTHTQSHIHTHQRLRTNYFNKPGVCGPHIVHVIKIMVGGKPTIHLWIYEKIMFKMQYFHVLQEKSHWHLKGLLYISISIDYMTFRFPGATIIIVHEFIRIMNRCHYIAMNIQ